MNDPNGVNDVEPLNWSTAKQQALLGHLFSDEKFFLQVAGKIDPKWFVTHYAERAFTAMMTHYGRTNRVATPAELIDWGEYTVENNAWRNAYRSFIETCAMKRADYGAEGLRFELTEWIRARAYYAGITKSARMFNAKKTDEAYAELQDAVRTIRDAGVDADPEVTFDTFKSDFEAEQKEYDNALTFGIPAFDQLLTPQARDGSLLLGDTTVILAPTNVGKTTAMVTIAAANVLKKKPTIVVTHEGRPEDIRKKLWCAILGWTGLELLEKVGTRAGRGVMEQYLDRYIRPYLTFVPMNRPGLLVEDVITVIMGKQEDRRAKYGSGYQLLVDDYPAKLLARAVGNSNWARRQIDDYVYNQFVAMAGEQKFHALLAIQTNREGSKINRNLKRDEKRLLTMEDVLESWGPMTAATNVVTLNRDPTAAARGRMTFYICKSRSSETGYAVVSETDFKRSRTHWPVGLKTTWYQGSGTMSAKIDQLLESYNGRSLPAEEAMNAIE